MATNRASGPLILTCDSPAYAVYADQILSVIDEANELKLLDERFAEQILSPDGAIICDRPHGDDAQSVAKSYFGLSVYCNTGKGAPNRIAAIRTLLFKVLALHYCIGEVQQNPNAEAPAMADYTEAIQNIHELAIRTQVRSLTANLFDPGSIKKAIQDARYDCTDPEVEEYLLALSRLLAKQPKHLHGLTTAIVWGRQYEFGYKCIQTAAESSNQSIANLCKANTYQIATVQEALFYLNKHSEAVALCQEIGLETVVKESRNVRFLLDSADSIGDFATLKALFTTYKTHIQAHMLDIHIKNAAMKAAENLGWYLYGEGKNKEARTLLKDLCGSDFSADQKSPMSELYKTLHTK